MVVDTTDTTGMGETRAAVVDSVLVGAEGRVTAVARADLGERSRGATRPKGP